MSKTKIVVCVPCKPHPFQDKEYGNQRRVANQCISKDKPTFRCTVCGKEHTS